MEKTYHAMANLAQESLYYFFKSDNPQQFLNNFYPLEDPDDNVTFNYWWIAHLVEVRIDAYERTHDQHFLDLAIESYDYNKTRNHGTLIHDYYDDMLWNALAAFRLYKHTNEPAYLTDAVLVWQDLVDTGWNDICGGGFAWRRPQMYYKNTPVNAPFIILSTWLYQQLKEEKYLTWAINTFDWLTKTLVRENGFVEDGINRNEDGQIDTQWEFSYNQGVYIGACLELYKITQDEKYLTALEKNIEISLDILTKSSCIFDEGDGGDIGLFKGIFYRYFTSYLLFKKDQRYETYFSNAIDILLTTSPKEDSLLMGMDWATPVTTKLPFSSQLSGMIALEMICKLSLDN